MNKQVEINILKQFLNKELIVDKITAKKFEQFLKEQKIPYEYLKFNNWQYSMYLTINEKPIIVFQEIEEGVRIYLKNRK